MAPIVCEFVSEPEAYRKDENVEKNAPPKKHKAKHSDALFDLSTSQIETTVSKASETDREKPQ